MSSLQRVSMPLPRGATLERRISALHHVKPNTRETFRHLLHCRNEKRVVDLSAAKLASLVGVSERTIRRHIRELTDKGLNESVYNGGRGKRAIRYPGARAAKKLATWAPSWPATGTTAAGGGGLGRLRLGNQQLKKRRRNPDTDVRVDPPDQAVCSVYVRASGSSIGDRDPQEPTGTGPLCEPVKDARPPTPLSGGSGDPTTAPDGPPNSDAPPSAHELVAPAPAQPGPGTDMPPTPTGARKKTQSQKGKRAQTEPTPIPQGLWFAAWGFWRQAHRAVRRGEEPPRHVGDGRTLRTLLTQALFAAQQNERDALHYFAWGVFRFLRDPECRGTELWQLLRRRTGYGVPWHAWDMWQWLGHFRERKPLRAPPSTPARSKGDPAPNDGGALSPGEVARRSELVSRLPVTSPRGGA